MPNFIYTARDETGSPATGTMAAASIAEVSTMLRQAGKYPISIKSAADDADPKARSATGVKISRAEVIQVSTQLSIMMETGVTLSEALDCIAAQAEKPNLKLLIEDLVTQVQGGTDLSAALGRHPRSFPRLYVALIKAAEKSGMMSKLLNRATTYLREEQEIMRKVKGALTYPAIMFLFAIGTTLFLLAFVLPKFTAIYASKGAALPIPTQILMYLSDIVVHRWPVILSVLVTLIVTGYYYVQTPRGRRTWHFIQLHTPLLGSMFKKLHLSRGMRMIGTMGSAGVSLVECVTVANDLCDNTYFQDLWNDVSNKIQAGKQMSEPLGASNLVPRSIAQMIHSGEKSGKLSFVMEQVASFSEAELKEKITELTRYIEPAMIVLMGAIIGSVALALMLPIFSISKVVAH